MDLSSLSLVLGAGVFALACCILSLFNHFNKGQVLFRLRK